MIRAKILLAIICFSAASGCAFAFRVNRVIYYYQIGITFTTTNLLVAICNGGNLACTIMINEQIKTLYRFNNSTFETQYQQ